MVIRQRGNWCNFYVTNDVELNSISYAISEDRVGFIKYTHTILQGLNKIICTLTLK
jgi:hypothetical protein